MATDPDRPAAPGPQRTLRHDAEVDREHTTAVHPPPGPPGAAPVIGPGREPRRDEPRDLRRQADAGIPDDPDRR
jgi:hypothetical protein